MRVVVFGTFDPLHEGHVDFFRQARSLGDSLLVIVARDSWISQVKNREPRESEEMRQKKVQEQKLVDEARLGDEWPIEDQYRLLGELEFDVLALGYDQAPDEEIVFRELRAHGRGDVQVVRLQPYQAGKYKSSRL